MGLRAAIRSGTELCALGTHQASFHEFIDGMRTKGLTKALQDRDAPFGDYRTTESALTLRTPGETGAIAAVSTQHSCGSREDQVDVAELVPEVALGEGGVVGQLDEVAAGDRFEHVEV